MNFQRSFTVFKCDPQIYSSTKRAKFEQCRLKSLLHCDFLRIMWFTVSVIHKHFAGKVYCWWLSMNIIHGNFSAMVNLPMAEVSSGLHLRCLLDQYLGLLDQLVYCNWVTVVVLGIAQRRKTDKIPDREGTHPTASGLSCGSGWCSTTTR